MNNPPKKYPAELSSSERKRLRGEAMGLTVAVAVGKDGLTDSVIGAVQIAFRKSPLIKIRLANPDKKIRESQLLAIEEKTGCWICGHVGRTASLYCIKNELAEFSREDCLGGFSVRTTSAVGGWRKNQLKKAGRCGRPVCFVSGRNPHNQYT